MVKQHADRPTHKRVCVFDVYVFVFVRVGVVYVCVGVYICVCACVRARVGDVREYVCARGGGE